LFLAKAASIDPAQPRLKRSNMRLFESFEETDQLVKKISECFLSWDCRTSKFGGELE
jgi:hypothetical protein